VAVTVQPATAMEWAQGFMAAAPANVAAEFKSFLELHQQQWLQAQAAQAQPGLSPTSPAAPAEEEDLDLFDADDVLQKARTIADDVLQKQLAALVQTPVAAGATLGVPPALLPGGVAAAIAANTALATKRSSEAAAALPAFGRSSERKVRQRQQASPYQVVSVEEAARQGAEVVGQAEAALAASQGTAGAADDDVTIVELVNAAPAGVVA